MSHHCLTVVLFIYIYFFFHIYILMYRHVQETKNVSVLHFCTKESYRSVLCAFYCMDW